MGPALDLMIDLVTDSAAISAAGLLPVSASFDPTATSSDTGADKTITLTGTMATMFGNSKVAGDTITLSDWAYHTIESTYVDDSGVTQDDYWYAKGYTQEIYFKYNNVEYWLDFNDDSTLVMTEQMDAAGNQLIVEGDFVNLVQFFGYWSSTINYTVTQYFDSDSTTTGSWASVAFDAYDATSASSGITANFDGYMDDGGAFLVGFIVAGTDDIPATAVASVESLTGSGSIYTPVYYGSSAVDDDTGVFGTLTKVSSGSAFAESSQSLKLYRSGTFVNP
jgi:hypothetical protein